MVPKKAKQYGGLKERKFHFASIRNVLLCKLKLFWYSTGVLNRHLANKLPTCCQQSAYSRPTVGRRFSYKAVNDSWPTVDQQSTDTFLGELFFTFGRSVPEISLILAEVTDHIYRTNGHLPQDLNQPWLEPQQLESFARAIHQRGAALSNCWGFVDGTVRPICRPGEHQRIMYNGHKRVHGIKFQSVVAPNGLIANLYGLVGTIS